MHTADGTPVEWERSAFTGSQLTQSEQSNFSYAGTITKKHSDNTSTGSVVGTGTQSGTYHSVGVDGYDPVSWYTGPNGFRSEKEVDYTYTGGWTLPVFGTVDGGGVETLHGRAESKEGDWSAAAPWDVTGGTVTYADDREFAITSPGFIDVDGYVVQGLPGSPNNNTNFGIYNDTNGAPGVHGTPPATSSTPAGNAAAPAKPAGPVTDPAPPSTWDYLKAGGIGFVQGWTQGLANVANGVQDAVIDTANFGVNASGLGAVGRVAGVDLTIPSPDWSKDLVIHEGDGAHAASKFLGGQGLLLIVTAGVGAAAELGEGAEVAESSEAALEGCGTEQICFLGGTKVLLGDGFSKTNIEDVYVGQRVATDGGVANSSDGQTAAEDPNNTQVDPATWRLVTIQSDDGDWNVQTLVPLSWLQQHYAEQGGDIQLSEVVDLKEMGVPDGLSGHIISIGDCPTIQSGPGRVVLTTINHSNDFVYTLTLTDADGINDSVGITGYHKVYTEDRGWVQAYDLHDGETVRTATGSAVVTGLVRNPGTFRVYNMTVESDHVYYVGTVDALVHNSCATGVTGQYEITYNNGQKYIGKGDYLRAIKSAQQDGRIAKNGGLKSIEWEQHATDAKALLAEAKAIKANGGIDGGKLLNVRNSPGMKELLKTLKEE